MAALAGPLTQVKLHSRLFKTRKGNIRKIVREHYLRSDIFCGSQLCGSCRSAFRKQHQTADDFDGIDDPEILELLQAELQRQGVMELDEDAPENAADALSSAAVLGEPERQAFPLGRQQQASDAEQKNKRRRRSASAAGGDPEALAPRTTYLLPDASVLLHQIDLLETCHERFQQTIYTQSALNHVKTEDFRLYERLRRLIRGEDRPAPANYVFSDLHHPGTYVVPKAGESEKDYVRACVISAAKWYAEHLRGRDVQIVVLTHLKTAFSAALDGTENVRVLSPADWVAGIPELMDLVAKIDEDSAMAERGAGAAAVQWSAHLSQDELDAGLANGSLFRAKFMHERSTQGFAVLSSGEQVLLPSAQAINRAVNGDRVVIRLLPPNKWVGARDDLVIDGEPSEDSKEEQEVQDAEREAAGVMDAFVVEQSEEEAVREAAADVGVAGVPLSELKKKAPRGAMPTGEVVAVEQRKWGTYAGSLELTDRAEGWCLFIPMNRQIPKVRIESSQIAHLMDKRILVRIDSWPANSRYPHGHYVRTLGPIGDADAETEVILHEYDIPHSEWTPEVLRCLPPLDYEIRPEEIQGRVDLRNILIFSIDPPGCTDIDDALHCRPLPNGNLEIGVHIADVTHYVRPGTALDLEASNRCTSTYLVNKRMDMLPTHLSSNLCSLMERVDRLAFSVVWEVTPEDVDIVDLRVHKSVIRSSHAYMYSQAQAMIDDPNDTSPQAVACRNMNHIAQTLRRRRREAGAVQCASVQPKFSVDRESQLPTEMALYESMEANALVEEFMLLANTSVARFTLRAFPQFAFLRRHPEPKEDKLLQLAAAAKLSGFDIDTTTSKGLADSLDAAHVPDFPFYNKLLRILTAQCMNEAVYFSSGSMPPQKYRHWCLAMDVYTHFTSPIRRYADIIVHRLLAAAIKWEALPKNADDNEVLHMLADRVNVRHRNALLAGRASSTLYTMLYFRGRVVQTEALVIGVKANGLQLLVQEYGITANLRVVRREVAHEYSFDDQLMELRHKGQVVHRLFEKLQVVVTVRRSRQRREWLVVELKETYEARAKQEGKDAAGGGSSVVLYDEDSDSEAEEGEERKNNNTVDEDQLPPEGGSSLFATLNRHSGRGGGGSSRRRRADEEEEEAAVATIDQLTGNGGLLDVSKPKHPLASRRRR